MQLTELLSHAEIALPKVAILGIKLDSRKVAQGDLFIALPGQQVNGMEFIDAAIDAGAVAVIHEAKDWCLDFKQTEQGELPCIGVPNLSAQVSKLAGRFYQEPSKRLALTGITGTNGKTTVSHLLAQLWQALSPPAALMGTVGSGLVGQLLPEALTTPDPVTVQQRLASFVAQGVTQATMEVSSHALAQGRVEALSFQTLIATNITRDHLDYHGSLEAYAAEKKRLFTDFSAPYRVLNLDDQRIASWAQSGDYFYSLNPLYLNKARTLVATKCSYSRASTRFTLHWGQENIRVESPLMGQFNVQNLLAVITAVLATGYSLSEVAPHLENLEAVPGRMESFQAAEKPLVIVDYAHTPDALRQLLKAVQSHAGGRVWCLFGCGGDRDRGKRPQMGQIAAEYADQLIITDDNPRTENPAQIIADIRAGVPQNFPVIEYPGRQAAIRYALEQASAKDVLVCAGKGHETYQEIGLQRQDYDERAYIAELLGLNHEESRVQAEQHRGQL